MTAADSAFRVICTLRSHLHSRARTGRELLDFVERSIGEGRARDFYISSDAPQGGIPSPELAEEVLRLGGRPLVSVSCAGRSREEVLAGLETLRGKGVKDVLLVTGDYPASPPPERPGHLFDIESLQLFMLLGKGQGPTVGLRKGCVVSPFKSLESELMWQYARLVRKIELGADFIVCQPGYDPRRWDEVIRVCRLLGLEQPVIGHIPVLDADPARRGAEGPPPGLPPSPALPDGAVGTGGGAEGALRLAARGVAALRGMGYQGVLLGGRLIRYGELHRILEESEELAPRWRENMEFFDSGKEGFYYFLPGTNGSFNSDTPGQVEPRRRRHPVYVLSYLIDYFAFGSWGPMFRFLAMVCRFCDRHRFWGRMLWMAEYLSKAPLYGCRMCGDCTLYACGFLCCEAGCPKAMVNGPCGGSVEGRCEVHPQTKKCVWVTVYDRLKGTAERPSFTAPPIPPRERVLDGTCSWINFCLGRDHRQRRAP